MIEADEKLHTVTVNVNGDWRTASVESGRFLIHPIRGEALASAAGRDE